MSANIGDLLGQHLLSSDGEAQTADLLEGKLFLGLYFAASWDEPSKAFTPRLTRWYNANADELDIEILYVSADADEISFEDCQ